MRITLRRPSRAELQQGLAIDDTLPFSYPEVGRATENEFPSGYDHDRNRCLLGKGQIVFERARILLREYRHFPESWAFVYAGGKAPEAQLTVVTTFRQFGWWWQNGVRVVNVIDEPNRYGWSYGTLTSHVERGEELFYVEIDKEENVYYGINAYSKPRFWGARLLKFYARSQQRRFVQSSMLRMQQLTADA